MLEISVRSTPYGPRLRGGAAKFAGFMMNAKRGDAAIEFGAQRYL